MPALGLSFVTALRSADPRNHPVLRAGPILPNWLYKLSPISPPPSPAYRLHTMAANGVNHSASRPLKAGIYAPIPSFFLPDTEDLGEFTGTLGTNEHPDAPHQTSPPSRHMSCAW
jgi:hypothetical protein